MQTAPGWNRSHFELSTLRLITSADPGQVESAATPGGITWNDHQSLSQSGLVALFFQNGLRLKITIDLKSTIIYSNEMEYYMGL